MPALPDVATSAGTVPLTRHDQAGTGTAAVGLRRTPSGDLNCLDTTWADPSGDPEGNLALRWVDLQIGDG